jgi:hypothetical protein
MMEKHIPSSKKTDSDTYTNSKASTIIKHCIILLTLSLNFQSILMRRIDSKFDNLLDYYEAKLQQSLTKDEYTSFMQQKKSFIISVMGTTRDKDEVHKKEFNELAHKLIPPTYERHLELIW